MISHMISYLSLTCNVVRHSQESSGIYPPIRSNHCAVIKSSFLPVLAIVGLKAEETFGTFVSLDVVLSRSPLFVATYRTL
jgi:hypothetical protein